MWNSKIIMLKSIFFRFKLLDLHFHVNVLFLNCKCHISSCFIFTLQRNFSILVKSNDLCSFVTNGAI